MGEFQQIGKSLLQSPATVQPGPSQTSNEAVVERAKRAAENEERRRQETLALLPEAIREQRLKWGDQCGLPPLFLGKTFGNFDHSLQPDAFEKVRRYAMFNDLENDDEGERSWWTNSLLLFSPNLYGVGKTHLLAALVNYMIATEEAAYISKKYGSIQRWPCPVFYLTEPELIARIRRTFDKRPNTVDGWGNEVEPETEDAIYEHLLKVSLLIIDDVGKTRPRDLSFLQGVYFRLIDGRYTGENPSMAIATNLSLEELEAHIGGACADRLREMCGDYIVKLGGKSYRSNPVKKPVPL